jgi:hypothetical protein
MVVFEKEKLEIKPQNCSDKYKPTDNSVVFEIDFGKAVVDGADYKAIKFGLSVNRNKKNSPFKAELKGIALFSFLNENKNSLNDEKVERMFIFNGSSIIFSFLRGYIFAKLGDLTPNCKILPTVNLLEVIEKAIKGETET